MQATRFQISKAETVLSVPSPSTAAASILKLRQFTGRKSGLSQPSTLPAGTHSSPTYFGRNIEVLPVLPDGLLGEAVDVDRDTGCLGSLHATHAPTGSFAISGHDAPHPHMIHPDPANRSVLQTDLGQDRFYVIDSIGRAASSAQRTPRLFRSRREMDHGTSSFIPIGAGCIRSRRRPL